MQIVWIGLSGDSRQQVMMLLKPCVINTFARINGTVFPACDLLESIGFVKIANGDGKIFGLIGKQPNSACNPVYKADITIWKTAGS